MKENPASKLKMPAFVKGAKSQAPTKGGADPLGLDDDSYDENAESSLDEAFSDEGPNFDPETTLEDASLEDLRAALAQKEQEKRMADAEDAEGDSGDEPAGGTY